MSTLEKWLHFQVWGTKAPRKPRKKSFNRGPARNWRYRAWIRTLPCAACGKTPSEAAHTGNDGGMRQKASDYSCVPLCEGCHRMTAGAYHGTGRHSGKAAFEAKHGISFQEIVKELNRVWFEFSGRVK